MALGENTVELHLEYDIDRNVNAAYLEAINGQHFANLRNARITESLLFAVFYVIVAVLAVEVGKVVVLAIAVLLLIVRAATLWQSLNPLSKAAAAMPEKFVSLTVDSEGLRETVAGVECFAPWSAVKEYVIVRGLLVIHLSSWQYAVVPSEFKNAKPEAFGELVRVLEQHGIRQRTSSNSA